jgi:hypothetical protein
MAAPTRLSPPLTKTSGWIETETPSMSMALNRGGSLSAMARIPRAFSWRRNKLIASMQRNAYCMIWEGHGKRL